MKSLRTQNYYEILGVSRYASPEEIRNAYELSKLTFTQNSLATYSLFSEEENEEILELIAKAYETLLNPELRREYDNFLDEGGQGSHHAWEARKPPRPATGEGQGSPEPVAPARPAAPEAPAPADAPSPELERFLSGIQQYTGPVLRRVRELKGMSLFDICSQTKIRQTYVEYIEAENFAGLPAPVYLRGFVKLMATALGLPPEQVAQDYMSRYRAGKRA